MDIPTHLSLRFRSKNLTNALSKGILLSTPNSRIIFAFEAKPIELFRQSMALFLGILNFSNCFNRKRIAYDLNLRERKN